MILREESWRAGRKFKLGVGGGPLGFVRNRGYALGGGSASYPLARTPLLSPPSPSPTPFPKRVRLVASSPQVTSHEGGQIQGRRQGRDQVGGEEQGRGEAGAQGQEEQGRQGPQQAQEGAQRLLRLHGRVPQGVQGEEPQEQIRRCRRQGSRREVEKLVRVGQGTLRSQGQQAQGRVQQGHCPLQQGRERRRCCPQEGRRSCCQGGGRRRGGIRQVKVRDQRRGRRRGQ